MVAHVLVVGFQSRNCTPYLAHYEALFEAHDVTFDTVFWEREGTPGFTSSPGVRGTAYSYHDATGTNVVDKTWRALGYMRHVRRLLRTGRYDRLVVLTSEPAFLLSRSLLGRYSGRYLFDYRDITFERLGWFRRRIDKVIASSYAAFFSSAGFVGQFREHEHTYVVHNVAHDVVAAAATADLRQRHPVRIGFIGFVRFPRENESLVDQLANNDRYLLSYAGTEFRSSDMAAHAAKVGARNVTTTGRYLDSDKPRLYESVDIINA
ncbi:MAG: hypothetical protein FWD11_03405, partial [Micrococcales bacterium]|nr:hypothetical protein [Micrococcales bacterium]